MDNNDYIEQLQKKYKVFLKRKIAGYPFDPIALRGVRTLPKDHQDFFAKTALYNTYDKATSGKGWTIIWRTIQLLGRQKWPSAITVDTEEDYLFLIGKKSSTKKILTRFDQLMQWQPGLQHLFEKYPDLIEKHEPLWDKLMPALDYLLQNNVQGKRIREISIPADTKFLEKNERILLQLLKFLSPERGHPEAKTLQEYLELGDFPNNRSMCWMDQQMAEKYTGSTIHFALNLSEWSKLTWEIDEVWLVENLTSLYSLPPRKKALAIFSKGFDLHRLKDIPSLHQARLYYWGDLDEHGYIMLSRMRELYPKVQSVLMDMHTLQQHIQHLHHIPFEGKERPRQLTKAEQEVYDFLEENNGRIEQERIRYDYLIQYISQLGN